MYGITNHAQARITQRSIPLDIVEFLYRNGKITQKPGHVIAYSLDRSRANSMIKELKGMIGLIEKTRKKVIITDENGSRIITVMDEK